MTYFEGFIVAVPDANKPAYVRHADSLSPSLRQVGVRRQVEAWESDVPDGKTTDFRKAVDAQPGEKTVFAWFEYPDKAARDAASERMMADEQMTVLEQLRYPVLDPLGSTGLALRPLIPTGPSAGQLRGLGGQAFANPGDDAQHHFGQLLEDVELTHLMGHAVPARIEHARAIGEPAHPAWAERYPRREIARLAARRRDDEDLATDQPAIAPFA